MSGGDGNVDLNLPENRLAHTNKWEVACAELIFLPSVIDKWG